MKLNLFFLLLLGNLLIACGNKATEPSKEEPKGAPQEEPKKDMPENAGNTSECYRYIGNRDTVNLRLIQTYNIMSGLLIYKNYQKDQNMGTIEGKMVGDVLLADYTFKSEGTVSTRQVAFKKIGSDLVEGYGDVKDVNGKIIFKDVNALKYDDARILKNVPCKQ